MIELPKTASASTSLPILFLVALCGVLLPSLIFGTWSLYYMLQLFGPRNRGIMSRFILSGSLLLLALVGLGLSSEELFPLPDEANVRPLVFMASIICCASSIEAHWAAWHLWYLGLRKRVGKKWD